MAPRGSKRAAPKAEEEPGAKRVADFLKTQGVSKASFQPVLEAVQHPLAELSPATRTMVLAALPWSLAVPAEQRHESQRAIVRMTGELLEAVQAKLQETLASDAGKVEELEGTKSTLEGEAQRTEASAEETSKVLEASRERVAQAEAAQVAKMSTLQEAEVAAQGVAAEVQTTRSLIAGFEEVLASSFATLREASFEESEAEGLIEKVMAMGQACSLEESLLATLPACLAKRERGGFDQQVLEQGEQLLRQKVAGFGEAATALEAQLVACQASVEAAKADLEAAGGTQTEAAEQLRGAEAASSTAAAAAAVSRQAVTEVQVKLAEAHTIVEQSREAAEGFKSYNVFMFEMLRDATSKQVEVATEEVAMEPATEEVAMEPAAEPQPAAEATLESKALSEERPGSKIPEQLRAGVAEAAALLGA